jgi:hypothetical protein
MTIGCKKQYRELMALVFLHDEKRERVDEPEMGAGLLERQVRSAGAWLEDHLQLSMVSR